MDFGFFRNHVEKCRLCERSEAIQTYFQLKIRTGCFANARKDGLLIHLMKKATVQLIILDENYARQTCVTSNALANFG